MLLLEALLRLAVMTVAARTVLAIDPEATLLPPLLHLSQPRTTRHANATPPRHTRHRQIRRRHLRRTFEGCRSPITSLQPHLLLLLREDHLSVPDLGKDFSASFLASPSTTPRASLAAGSSPLSREEARSLFLPRLVVRCIESLERWGPSEEGIYRISGRSSHTNKLRSHFADARNDLKLDEVSPADLDINSVCSLLKSYLRELPEPLIPVALGKTLDAAVGRLLSSTSSPEGGGGKATDARVGQISPRRWEWRSDR